MSSRICVIPEDVKQLNNNIKQCYYGIDDTIQYTNINKDSCYYIYNKGDMLFDSLLAEAEIYNEKLKKPSLIESLIKKNIKNNINKNNTKKQESSINSNSGNKKELKDESITQNVKNSPYKYLESQTSYSDDSNSDYQDWIHNLK